MNGNYRKSTKNKKGITMLTLIITIVVGLIIVSAGIVTVSNSISNATITAFANDLNTIQDQVNLYYMQNDSFPVYDGEDAYAQIDITDLASANGNYAEFQEELELNGDWNDNGSLGAFYKIDLSKLNVEKTVRGTKQNSDESDIYVVSYPSMNIYYVKGVEVKSETYFSLSSKIIKFVKNVENTSDDTSNTDVITAGSLTVKKLKKDWTNKLAFTLNAYMNSGESLYVDIGGVQYKFKTNVGNNTFVLNTFDDLENSLSNISSDELYSDDINHWISTDKQILNIYKTGSDSSKIDSLDIDMSNFDGKSPTANNWNIIENNENNILTFKVADTESGVKEVRYEYLQKYGENGNLEKYYVGVDSLDPYFIKSRGKKATLSKDGNVEISLPKEIEGIQLVVIDKAGNMSLVEDDAGNKVLPITKGIPSDFIGCTLKSINDSGLTFKVAFNAKGDDCVVESYTAQVSLDGNNYTGNYSETLATPSKIYSAIVNEYNNGLNITEYVFVKIVANISSPTLGNYSKERVVRFSINDDVSDDTSSSQQVNAPVYNKETMIPVEYSGSQWVKVDSNNKYNSWYNYDPLYKKWANVAIVKETGGTKTRQEYLNAPVGTPIADEDILEMFVWIPRYAYSITNGAYRSNLSNNSNRIEIEWLQGTSNVGFNGVTYQTDYDEDALSIGDTTPMIVHRAFVNDPDNGGWDKDVEGIWIAKYIYNGSDSSSTNLIRYSLATSIGHIQNFQEDGNIYGLVNEKDNPHMIKDTEYGAYTYLTFSKYGYSYNTDTIGNSVIFKNNVISSTGNVYGIFGDRAYLNMDVYDDTHSGTFPGYRQWISCYVYYYSSNLNKYYYDNNKSTTNNQNFDAGLYGRIGYLENKYKTAYEKGNLESLKRVKGNMMYELYNDTSIVGSENETRDRYAFYVGSGKYVNVDGRGTENMEYFSLRTVLICTY